MPIYILRHGETDHNRNQMVQGHAEVPLNDAGIAQAARAAERFAAIPHDRIISSDLRRAVMTATCIAARSGAPIEYDSGFRERDPGVHTGQSYEEAINFFMDPSYDPPEGESVAVFHDRIKDAFDRFAERYSRSNESTVIVTHGMVCEAFCQLYLDGGDAPDARAWGNASITTVEYDGVWNLVALNDTDHLDGESLPARAHRTGG